MSYNPSDRNPSGVVFFGFEPSGSKFDSNSSFTFDGSTLLSPNIKISDNGYLGTVTTPNAIQIESDGTFNIYTLGAVSISGQPLSETAPSDALIVFSSGDQTFSITKSNFVSDLGGGTVTSVAVSGTDGIDVDSGSPITSAGTIVLGLSNVPNSSLANSSFTASGDSGNGSISLGGSLGIGGGTGIETSFDTETVTVTLSDTAVTPGDYGSASGVPVLTIDQQGRITSASTVSVTVSKTIESVSSNGNITKDYTLATGGVSGITLTLLDSQDAGTTYTVKKVDSDVGTVIVSRQTSSTIDGTTSKTLYYQYESMTFVSDGTDWFIV